MIGIEIIKIKNLDHSIESLIHNLHHVIDSTTKMLSLCINKKVEDTTIIDHHNLTEIQDTGLHHITMIEVTMDIVHLLHQ